MRTYQHVIDSKAIKKTLQAIPDYWVVRELSERDYGIDLMIEIFSEAGTDQNGHDVYETTGHVCYLQLKGTNSELTINQDDSTVSFSIEKKALLYVEKFSTPFILVRTCTLDESDSIYYLWLQRYILEILDVNAPDWRTSSQNHFTVRIPITNKLPDNSAKIEKISSRIKYIEEHAEFYERYILMQRGYQLMINGEFTEEQFGYFINDLKRIQTFHTLLTYNNCQVDVDDITNLIAYIHQVRNGQETPTKEEDFLDPLLFNLDLLLHENFMRLSAETMIAENEDDTVY